MAIGIKMTQEEFIKRASEKNPDFDFYDLLSNELRSDGVIHDIWKTRHYLTYNPENIKLSKAITFDDNGEIIPIVKRDNFRNLDTRYNKGGKL